MEIILSLITLALILAEWLYGKIRGTEKYTLRNSALNTVLGLFTIFSEFLCTLVALPVFVWIHKHVALFHFQSYSVASFIILFIAIDFFDYWYHRLSHKVSLLWAAHIVHHQSEEYNITVGLRASFLVPVLNIMGYTVFPLIGFDPYLVLPILLITGMYNLVIHTEFVGRLGWLEYILVTPSSHRVHHASNSSCHDRNFGKLLAVWDIIFGTYSREKKDEPLKFGVADARGCGGISSSLFFHFKKIFILTRSEKRWREKFKIMLGSPDYTERLYRKKSMLIPMPEER